MTATRPVLAALATLALGLAAPLPASASSHGNALVHSRKFNGIIYMMNQVHMSLYTYARDKPGVSTCYDDCARNWPPVILDAGAKLGENYSLIKRKDGRMQAAYKGRPLYMFIGDKKPGDINGDGVGGVWRLAKPLP